MAKWLDLDLDAVRGADGEIDESFVVPELRKKLLVWPEHDVADDMVEPNTPLPTE